MQVFSCLPRFLCLKESTVDTSTCHTAKCAILNLQGSGSKNAEVGDIDPEKENYITYKSVSQDATCQVFAARSKTLPTTTKTNRKAGNWEDPAEMAVDVAYE
ncbi:hypothetical protein MLD38_009645 [Melastoma candidum]|uniref:Uncharacterized protein n=1 Tax=Melastoma candidum TaxID=119954 RepID=A0ACB9RY89_9MYRT|nr:hypothetical protein MLD38_009645 [Melastoma candidum]